MSFVDVRTPASRLEVGQWPDLNDARRRAELTPAAVKALAETCRRLESAGQTDLRPHGRIVIEQLARLEDTATQRTQRRSTHSSLAPAGCVHRTSCPSPRAPRRRVAKPAEHPPDFQRTNSTPGDDRRGIPAMVQVRALLDGRRGGQ